MVMHDSCNSSSGNRDGGVTVVVMNGFRFFVIMVAVLAVIGIPRCCVIFSLVAVTFTDSPIS